METGKIKAAENMDSRLLNIEIIRFRFTPQNINNFYAKDNRVGTPEFNEEMRGIKKAILETSSKTKRYHLTVFTYNQHAQKPFWIIDGSHRLEVLREMFKEKTLDFFDAILIPSNILYYNMTPTEMMEANRNLDKELEKEGIPIWVKKYDYDEPVMKEVDGTMIIDDKRNIWCNKMLIDSGGKNKIRMTLKEYEAMRQQQ